MHTERMGDHHLHLHPHEPAEGGPPPGCYPDGLIEAYVEAAAKRGVDEIGFTEHLYRCTESETALGRWWEYEPDQRLAEHTKRFVGRDRNLSLDSYVEAVQGAKDRGLPVALGLEVDFFPETMGAVLDLIAPYPWDFLIGSVHWIGGWAVDTAEVSDEFARRGVRRAWEQYFELETQLAASGAVDVLAHVDVCKKHGQRPEREPVDLYLAVVEAASGSGTAVEVSSQGLRKPVGEVYPAPTFLEMFNRAGVPITLASDGHAPNEAAWGHEEVVAAARLAGYASSLRFKGRRRWEVPLR